MFACALAATLSVAACSSSGTSSENAALMLAKTFGSSTVARSGVIDLQIKVVPSGSSIIESPLTLTISGPFDRGSDGSPGTADLTASFNGLALSQTAELVELTNSGYLTLDGSSYKLPSAELARLRSGTGQSGSSAGMSGGSLASLLRAHWDKWLIEPKVVGTEELDGVKTERVSGSLDPQAVLELVRGQQLRSAALDAGAKTGRPTGVAKPLSEARIAKTAKELGSPSFEVWTGVNDHLLCKLVVSFKATLDGSLAAVKTAAVTITLQYEQINQRQTITAPTQLKPYAQLQRKLEPVFEDLFGSGQLSKYF